MSLTHGSHLTSIRQGSQTEQPAIQAKTILMVDAVAEIRSITKLFLSSCGYVVHSLASAAEALALFDSRVHDLVLTDNTMSGMTGEEMAHIIKMRSRSTPVLMYTDRRPADCSCVDLFIQKPTSLTALKDGVDRLLAHLS